MFDPPPAATSRRLYVATARPHGVARCLRAAPPGTCKKVLLEAWGRRSSEMGPGEVRRLPRKEPVDAAAAHSSGSSGRTTRPRDAIIGVKRGWVRMHQTLGQSWIVMRRLLEPAHRSQRNLAAMGQLLLNKSHANALPYRRHTGTDSDPGALAGGQPQLAWVGGGGGAVSCHAEGPRLQGS